MAPSMPRGGKFGMTDTTRRLQPQIVAEHRDVETAERNLGAFDGTDSFSESSGEGNAAGGNAQQDQGLSALVPLKHLMSNAGQRALHVVGVKHIPCAGAGR